MWWQIGRKRGKEEGREKERCSREKRREEKREWEDETNWKWMNLGYCGDTASPHGNI